MRELFNKLISILDRRQRRQLRAVAAAILAMGLIEVIGISSVLPFMAVVANPEIIHTSASLHTVYTVLGFSGSKTFLMFLGGMALGMVLFSNVLSFVVSAAILKFSYSLSHTLSVKMLAGYLQQPYSFFLSRNSTHLVLNSTDEVVHMINGVLIPAIQAVAKVVVAAFVVALVVIVDPVLALGFGIVLGGVYALIFRLVRRKVAILGEESQEMNRVRFRLATEAFSGIKELKVLTREEDYLQRFAETSSQYSRYQWLSATIILVPRYALDAIAFGSVLLLVLYLLESSRGVAEALPLMVLYAFTAYRLLPTFQQVFASLTAIRFNLPSLEVLFSERSWLALEHARDNTNTVRSDHDPVPFQRDIEIVGATYRYPQVDTPVIEDLTLRIARNSTVAIVGPTGSGKTTVVDLLLGLLEPQAGAVVVDGTPLSRENIRRWQVRLGYVPQLIYLSDDTVERNIAFGVQPAAIEMNKVVAAARLASLHEFVVGELPQQYQTQVGERGVRLSGGQRQRIGIARALYHDPDVLILDEATSALDGVTEDAIIQAICTLAHQKTIITIAHRLTTIRNCDVIYLLDHGRIKDYGAYDELLKKSQHFRALAQVRD